MHFFKVYKQLENKQTDVKELYDRETAEKIVAEAINGYVDKFCR
jgi:inorganic pyrophosphatase